jgi:Glu-tRNA(Gln) amidotransferase subunit E-like FAD-binding protein
MILMKKEEHNYEELGFKCGLEIHQQLEGKKLFCNCPTEIRKDEPDFEVTRKLKASAGEEGVIDKAALHEQKKQKHFVYQGYNDITCQVELDEEPPLPVNQDALRAALQIAKMLNCKIIDKIQVMRKTVIDGSNVSGFQRTMLVGVSGYIEVKGRKIRIDTVCLEEEACQVVERKKDHDIYNLSRLGIPLIEIATAADIRTPEEAREAAAKLGMILRSVPICKRGIGSIRQDVNLSIKGGNRVEIKGFQELKSIPKVIDYEIERHLTLLKKGEGVPKEVRKAEANFSTKFLRPMPGASRMYPETDIPEIIPSHKEIEIVATIEQRASDLVEAYKISLEAATQLVKKDIDFAKYAAEYAGVEAKFIAETLINTPKEIKTRFGKEIDIVSHADEIFHKLSSGEISKAAVFEILAEIAHGKKPDFAKYKALSDDNLEIEIIDLIEKNKKMTIPALMGQLMKKHPGKIDGKLAMQFLKKHKKE